MYRDSKAKGSMMKSFKNCTVPRIVKMIKSGSTGTDKNEDLRNQHKILVGCPREEKSLPRP